MAHRVPCITGETITVCEHRTFGRRVVGGGLSEAGKKCRRQKCRQSHFQPELEPCWIGDHGFDLVKAVLLRWMVNKSGTPCSIGRSRVIFSDERRSKYSIVPRSPRTSNLPGREPDNRSFVLCFAGLSLSIR